MAASKYDFPIEQGSSFRLAIVYKDKDNVIVDITNWCARLIWKTNNNTTQIFTTENNDPTLYDFSIDGPNGKITLLLPASITNNFNFNIAKYDLELLSDDELYSGGGKQTSRILYGTVTITKRYSQSSILLECSE
jgi:hypothetical protein